MEIIFWSSVALFIIAAIAVAVMVIKERKLYENKSEIPGLLDDCDLSEEEMGVQYSEFPTFDVY